MSLMITSELSKTYFKEEDAVKGFKIAVDNNQVRLALQILTEIVDAFVEGFQVIIESSEDQEVEKPKEQEELKVEEKKITNKKVEQKEENTKDSK